jgi:serine/threonine-protein kinase
MSEIEEIRAALRKLKLRLAQGDIDAADYHWQRDLIVADLSPAECLELGQTPAPRGPSGITPGPSGGPGAGMRTGLPSLAALDLEPGTELFGQWRILSELGRGGFGAVFEAQDLHLDRTLAIKVLDPAMAAKPELLARFRREVTLMRDLFHPRIVRVFDYREDKDQDLALASMELVRGCSVRELAKVSRNRGQPVPVAMALRILEQTLEALAAAHAEGMIHRDVTPGNILLAGGNADQLLTGPDQNPGVKLVDFGIAALVERSEVSRLSRVQGTAAYVAPEILEPSAEVTPAADLFGAGAVAYALLTGALPMVRFPLPSERRPELGREVDALLLRLLDANPAARPLPEQARRAASELAKAFTAAGQARAERRQQPLQNHNRPE